MKNSERYPDAWQFYIENSRNIINEPELNSLGNYRIPEPNESGNFIYADTIESLWSKFINFWFLPDINSASVYGKIQGIIERFNR